MQPRLSEVAMGTDLFRGFGREEAENLLLRLNGIRKTYAKGETVVHAGLPAERLMAVASGHLHVYEQMTEDRPVLVREIGVGEVLGLWIMYVPEITCWPGTVVAAEPCTLISLDLARARTVIAEETGGKGSLLANASRLLARELFSMWQKLSVMDAQTIESRIKIYLSELNNESGRTGEVTVPFNRERMAEFFGVTRPSLSRTLCQMRDRGLLSWKKRVFTINF